MDDKPIKLIKIRVIGEVGAEIWKGPNDEPFEPYEIVVAEPTWSSSSPEPSPPTPAP